MRRIVAYVLWVVVAGAALTGCGGNKGEGEALATSTPSGSPSAGTVALPAGLDEGPRAAAGSIDEHQAETGEALFQSKGCSACHGFGARASCPDLQGVSTRRTVKWLESQILHPDLMVKQDPIARQLFVEFSLQMPKQGLSEVEARAVIEFLKYKDHETGEETETGKGGDR